MSEISSPTIKSIDIAKSLPIAMLFSLNELNDPSIIPFLIRVISFISSFMYERTNIPFVFSLLIRIPCPLKVNVDLDTESFNAFSLFF